MEPKETTEGTTPQHSRKSAASKRPVEAIRSDDQIGELVDQIGPDTARALIDAAVLLYAADTRAEVWRQRMEKTRRAYRIHMMNLKHDFQTLCLEWNDEEDQLLAVS